MKGPPMTITRIPRRPLRRFRVDRQARRAPEEQRLLQILIGLAQRPVAGQPPLDLDAVRGDLERLHTVGVTTRLAGAASADLGVAPAVPDPRPGQRRLHDRAIGALQRQLHDLFESLLGDADALVHPYYRLTPQVACVYLTRVGDGQVASITVGSEAPDRFWWNVLALLQRHGSRIRRCQARTGSRRCGRLFVRTRRQTFCSPTCAQRERARRRYDLQRAATERRTD